MRYWLVELPAYITEVAAAWYRLYFIVVLLVAGPGLLLMASIAVGLWFGFGIRWGW